MEPENSNIGYLDPLGRGGGRNQAIPCMLHSRLQKVGWPGKMSASLPSSLSLGIGGLSCSNLLASIAGASVQRSEGNQFKRLRAMMAWNKHAGGRSNF